MTSKQIDILIEYIQMAIKQQSIETKESSDGGLIEIIQLMQAETDLREAFQDKP